MSPRLRLQAVQFILAMELEAIIPAQGWRLVSAA